MRGDRYDLAIVGAGVAGTYIGDWLKRARPDWSVVIIERTSRIGGRLRSIPISGLDHPIGPGGMRFMSSHRRVVAIDDDFKPQAHTMTRSCRFHTRGSAFEIPCRNPIDGGLFTDTAWRRSRGF
jgi:cation diffusion facilitator CzcD-associated flavoprotein CzcO